MTNELFKTVVAKLNFSLVNKTPVILQSESSECGIACLAMVCGYYGLNIDLFNFRQRFGSPSQGSSLMSLSKTAEHAGLKSRALALDLDEIKQLKLPCIIHWGMNHYVVLTKVRKTDLLFTIRLWVNESSASARCQTILPALHLNCGPTIISNKKKQNPGCDFWILCIKLLV